MYIYIYIYIYIYSTLFIFILRQITTRWHCRTAIAYLQSTPCLLVLNVMFLAQE